MQTELFAADQSNDFAPGPPRRKHAKQIVIALPQAFLPCVSDHETLRVMADMVDEAGNSDLAGLLRWTANAWKWGHGMSLESAKHAAMNSQEVWVRFHHFGWSRGSLTWNNDGSLYAVMRHWRASQGIGNVIPIAWWDVEQGTTNAHKPKPRKGYTNGTNAELALKLAGVISAASLGIAEPDQARSIPGKRLLKHMSWL